MNKIALFTHYDLSVFRGGEKFIISLANALSEYGCEVTIYSLPFQRGKIDPVKYISKKVRYSSSFSFRRVEADVSYYVYIPLAYNLFFKDTSSRRIAGLHGYAIVPELSAKELWGKSLFGFLRLHGFKATLAYLFNKLFKKRDLSKFDIIHVVNPFTLLPTFLSNKALYLPLWTDYRRTKSIEEDEELFTVLMLGTYNYMKGRDICESILQYFRRKKELKIKFKSNTRFGNDVESFGFLDESEMPNLLSNAHVVLYPSRLDTFGMVIIESLNCGTPVVTSDILAHKIFSKPVYLCSNLENYVKRILYLYNLWEKGNYPEIRKASLREGEKFSKDKVFPLYRRMFLC